MKYKDKDISTLDDIQKLKAKDLRDILRSHSESTGGMKADLVLKVYALLMRHVLPSSNANSGENEEVPSPQDQEQSQDECDFKYEVTMRRISALGWSSDLRDLPEMNFIQLCLHSQISSHRFERNTLQKTKVVSIFFRRKR